ncbi:hypothetical protein AN958_00532 [Leucoagaricus sp. SymC.cos]|nr:hypothetical protein AN958_00532 [Leucoagaricus sp. SymC.cos]
MPDSFFASSKSRKRKRTQNETAKKAKKQKLDEELSEQSSKEWGDIDDMDLRAEEPDPNASGDEDKDETPAEKRLRLAQLYLDTVKESLADGEFDAAEIDKELISSRLKQDVLSHSGKVHLFIASYYSSSLLSSHPSPPTLRTRGHRFSVTSAVASESSRYLFTAGKEGHIIKWDLITGKKLSTIYKSRPSPPSTSKSKGKGKANSDTQGHTDEILALALSSDGKYLASGGRDRRLIIWNTSSLTCLKVFQGPMNHKDVISALSFRHQSHQLFTASFDRTIKLYDLTPTVMGYIETLFGHQDSILSLSSLRSDNCVSVGGRDKTARYWKIVEESQLVFRGGGRRKEKSFVEGSLECIAMIDDSTFVTGGDSGSISLWSTQKKKPIFTYPLAHGLHTVHSSTSGPIQTPRWITSLASLPYSDLFASGSWEGQIRLWKLDSKLRSFSPLGGGGTGGGVGSGGSIPIPGIINSLQLIAPPKSFFTATTNNHTTSTAASSSSPSTNSNQNHTNNSDKSWLPPVATHHKSDTMPTILMIAGTGQEHRFGRWLTVKENGAVNGAYVVALIPTAPRTLS